MRAVADRHAPPRDTRWLAALIPLTGLALLILVLATGDPLRGFARSSPAEAIAVERTTLREGSIELSIRNDGRSHITLAQALVDDAFWSYTASRHELARLQTATVRIPYPWEEGHPLHVVLVTSTGAVIRHDIEAATASTTVDTETLSRYGLLGLLIGVAPIALGLLWLPTLRRASPTVIGFLVAFTVGLLALLLVETLHEGLEMAARAPSSLNGIEVFVASAFAALAVMAAVDRAIARGHSDGASPSGVASAYLVAVGIGLHNFGEGLAVSAAVSAGELALGSSLLVGFALHNATEGLAIATPLAPSRAPKSAHLVALVAVAGLPTVLGAWAGGLAVTPLWSTAAFGLAAGAIAQVVILIGRRILRHDGLTPTSSVGFVVGMAVMYATGIFAT
jgi:zinc transporter ZupT